MWSMMLGAGIGRLGGVVSTYLGLEKGECLIEDGTLDGLLVSKGMKAKTGVYNKEKLCESR